jgi:hypothetical protein
MIRGKATKCANASFTSFRKSQALCGLATCGLKTKRSKKMIDNTQKKPYNSNITIEINKPMIENSRFGHGLHRELRMVRTRQEQPDRMDL